MKKEITQELLYELYINQKLNPYQIADQLKCNHKTIRSYLRKFKITLRTASEYNYLPKIAHISPTEDLLQSKLSLIAHSIYICEGWHTEKTNYLHFCNQDTVLIDIFVKCLRQTYSYKSTIIFEIQLNKKCNISKAKADEYARFYPNEKVRFSNDSTRKNPIIKIRCGGKNFAREFIENAYKLLDMQF